MDSTAERLVLPAIDFFFFVKVTFQLAFLFRGFFDFYNIIIELATRYAIEIQRKLFEGENV